MFAANRWAKAFFDVVNSENGKIEDSIAALRVFSSWVKTLKGEVFGSSAAKKIEALVRSGAAGNAPLPDELEAAVRLFVLLVKKNAVHHIDAVIGEAQKLLNKKNRVLLATAEYVAAPEESFYSRVKEALIKKTGAARVELTGRANPGLIGGYRLWIGDQVIDASIRSQLRKMEACLNEAADGAQFRLDEDGGS